LLTEKLAKFEYIDIDIPQYLFRSDQ